MVTIQARIAVVQGQLIAFKGQMGAIWKPKAPETPLECKSTLEAMRNQRLARITKTALYILATAATCTMIVLTEASVIVWSSALPAIALTILAWGAFIYLNKIDGKYLEGLNDNMRSAIAKKELENLFKSPLETLTTKKIDDTLTDMNRLLNWEVFKKDFRENLTTLLKNPQDKKTLAEVAKLPNSPLKLELEESWREKGHYGWNAKKCSLKITWSPQPEELIAVTYAAIEEQPGEITTYVQPT